MASIKDRNPFFEVTNIIIALIGTFGIIIGFRIFPADVTVKIVILIISWILNLSLKGMMGFINRTSFADLSLSAFMLIAGQVTEVIINLTKNEPLKDNNSFVELIYAALLLCVIWVINLYTCRLYNLTAQEYEMDKTKKTFNEKIYWSVSTILGFLSFSGALYPHYIWTFLKELHLI
jgi:hypothetical protein